MFASFSFSCDNAELLATSLLGCKVVWSSLSNSISQHRTKTAKPISNFFIILQKAWFLYIFYLMPFSLPSPPLRARVLFVICRASRAQLTRRSRRTAQPWGVWNAKKTFLRVSDYAQIGFLGCSQMRSERLRKMRNNSSINPRLKMPCWPRFDFSLALLLDPSFTVITCKHEIWKHLLAGSRGGRKTNARKRSLHDGGRMRSGPCAIKSIIQ